MPRETGNRFGDGRAGWSIVHELAQRSNELSTRELVRRLLAHLMARHLAGELNKQAEPGARTAGRGERSEAPPPGAAGRKPGAAIMGDGQEERGQTGGSHG